MISNSMTGSLNSARPFANRYDRGHDLFRGLGHDLFHDRVPNDHHPNRGSRLTRWKPLANLRGLHRLMRMERLLILLRQNSVWLGRCRRSRLRSYHSPIRRDLLRGATTAFFDVRRRSLYRPSVRRHDRLAQNLLNLSSQRNSLLRRIPDWMADQFPPIPQDDSRRDLVHAPCLVHARDHLGLDPHVPDRHHVIRSAIAMIVRNRTICPSRMNRSNWLAIQ